MTRYIVKEYTNGEVIRKTTITLPNGLHPRTIRPDCPLNQFQPGARIYYESNGLNVGLIYRNKMTGMKRVRWYRI